MLGDIYCTGEWGLHNVGVHDLNTLNTEYSDAIFVPFEISASVRVKLTLLLQATASAGRVRRLDESHGCKVGELYRGRTWESLVA